MPNNNNRINFQVGYNVDQASVNAVKKSLQDLQNIKFKDYNGPKQDLDDIKQKASQVEAALNKAFNVKEDELKNRIFSISFKKEEAEQKFQNLKEKFNKKKRNKFLFISFLILIFGIFLFSILKNPNIKKYEPNMINWNIFNISKEYAK